MLRKEDFMVMTALAQWSVSLQRRRRRPDGHGFLRKHVQAP